MESSSREAPSWLQKGRDWLEAMRLSVAATSPAAAARGVTVETERSQGRGWRGCRRRRRRRRRGGGGEGGKRRGSWRLDARCRWAVLRRRSTGRSRDTLHTVSSSDVQFLRAGTPAPWR